MSPTSGNSLSMRTMKFNTLCAQSATMCPYSHTAANSVASTSATNARQTVHKKKRSAETPTVRNQCSLQLLLNKIWRISGFSF